MRAVAAAAGTPCCQLSAKAFKSATVTDTADGQIRVSSLADPVVQRLAEPGVLEAIKEGLTPFVGRRPVLVIDGAQRDATPGRRVTESEVREDALRALYRQEPRLERAVEELDLELME